MCGALNWNFVADRTFYLGRRRAVCLFVESDSPTDVVRRISYGVAHAYTRVGDTARLGGLVHREP